MKKILIVLLVFVFSVPLFSQRLYETSNKEKTIRGDTLSHSTHSLALSPLSIWARIIVEAREDTLEFSFNSAFTNSRIVYPNSAHTVDKKDLADTEYPITYVYYRAYGDSCVAPYQIIIDGR